MLPLILVLFLAQNALSLPYTNVNFYNIENAPSIPDNGQLINSNVTTGALEWIDGGDVPLYLQILMTSVNDIAAVNQAAAAIQTIVILGETAPGIPGDACEAAALINASANNAGLRPSLVRFIQRIAGYIDTIVRLVNNPNSVRYSSGSRGNCLGGGRSCQFEAAWDRILRESSPYDFGLLNEEYCAAKRLSTAWNLRSNNVATAITAATIPEVREVVRLGLPEVGEFLRVLSYGGNPGPAGQAAKAALLQRVSQVKC
ncbi:fibroin light chain [Bicyclus anynana]|uniref:Fibroin light chain n=1 Tax=Bicyclus anynana TaxID=110368 RepID=A0ABM3M053_BICAN|nr:fibroin light chain [Bicyclus anynana]